MALVEDDPQEDLGALLERSRELREAASRLRREVEARDGKADGPADDDPEEPAP